MPENGETLSPPKISASSLIDAKDASPNDRASRFRQNHMIGDYSPSLTMVIITELTQVHMCCLHNKRELAQTVFRHLQRLTALLAFHICPCAARETKSKRLLPEKIRQYVRTEKRPAELRRAFFVSIAGISGKRITPSSARPWRGRSSPARSGRLPRRTAGTAARTGSPAPGRSRRAPSR